MLETLISLKVILILLLGLLILDEIVLNFQTLETVNFYSSRAIVVHENTSDIDDFFNLQLKSRTIFTNINGFFHIQPIETRIQANHTIESFISFEPYFQMDEHLLHVSTMIPEIEKP